MKRFITFICIIGYIIVTFFGLGPILLADGSFQERALTLGVVLLLYILIMLLHLSIHKK
ncbi:MAG: DUF6954 family protein [Bacillaceae bacterium]